MDEYNKSSCQAWWCMPIILAIWEVEVRGSQSKTFWAKMKILFEKQTKSKSTGVMVQVAKHLPNRLKP
jgi:hypothetical protein